MLELREKDYDDNEYDNCGNVTIAVLSINSIDIPLCEKCTKKLLEDLTKLNEIIFCYKCDNFIMSHAGWFYGGSCKYKALQYGMIITEKDAGYKCVVECMHTCENAIPRK